MLLRLEPLEDLESIIPTPVRQEWISDITIPNLWDLQAGVRHGEHILRTFILHYKKPIETPKMLWATLPNRSVCRQLLYTLIGLYFFIFRHSICRHWRNTMSGAMILRNFLEPSNLISFSNLRKYRVFKTHRSWRSTLSRRTKQCLYSLGALYGLPLRLSGLTSKNTISEALSVG